MVQEHKQPRRSTEPDADAQAAPAGETVERKGAMDDDVDAILDEIDEVLESNAEDFVKSFIQKGGQ